MTIQDNDPKKEDYGKYDPDDLVVEATPAADTGPPIAPGHRRFYCEKCRAPYDLPQGATSWRCANCSHFNSTVPMQMPCCTIM